MTRSAAYAAVLGAVVGVSSLSTAITPAWKNPTPPRSAADGGLAESATDAWPICTSMGSLGENTDWARLDPDFAAGLKALTENDWNGAIRALAAAALRDARNADVQNYLGYAYRRLRRLDAAFTHYQVALTLNPRQRSAHEHLGEAYLVVGNLAKAEEHLAALERICLIPCEQYDSLKKAIETSRGLQRRISTDPTL
jgi:tetratricopeptide (TPR) repeat protein